MNLPRLIAMSGAAASLLVANAFAAQPNGGPNAFAQAIAAARTSPEAIVTTKAKIAVYYTPFGGIVRSKGVLGVTNPATGIYCITPSVAVDLTGVYPQVSVEWNLSSGFSLQAYWKNTPSVSDCPAGDLEVTTYDFNAGGPAVLSGVVAFNLNIN